MFTYGEVNRYIQNERTDKIEVNRVVNGQENENRILHFVSFHSSVYCMYDTCPVCLMQSWSGGYLRRGQ